jgi:hypothetical protein
MAVRYREVRVVKSHFMSGSRTNSEESNRILSVSDAPERMFMTLFNFLSQRLTMKEELIPLRTRFRD